MIGQTSKKGQQQVIYQQVIRKIVEGGLESMPDDVAESLESVGIDTGTFKRSLIESLRMMAGDNGVNGHG